MGIFRRKGKRKAELSAKDLALLEGLPYAGDFDLPRETHKLHKVYEHDARGGNFEVVKVLGSRGFRYSPVAILDHFPSQGEVLECVEDNYGGGTYVVRLHGKPGVVKTYQVPGPSRFHTLGPKPKPARQALLDRLEEGVAAYLDELFETGSDEGRLIIKAYLQKRLGVELPEEPSWAEKRIQERLETDPELADAYLEAELRKRGIRKPKEPSELDQQLARLHQLVKLKERLDKSGQSGRPKGDSFREILAEGLRAVTEIARLMNSGKPAGSTSEQLEQAPIGLATPPPGQPSPNQGIMGVAPAGRAVSPSPPSSSQPIQSSLSNRPRRIPAPPATTTQVDTAEFWSGLIKGIDWAELEHGVHGEPAEYLDKLQSTARGNLAHAVLLGEFASHEPAAIRDVLSQSVERLRVEAGKGEEYEIAVLVLKHLTETPEGKRWLDEVHAAARALLPDEVGDPDGADLGSGVSPHPALGEDEGISDLMLV